MSNAELVITFIILSSLMMLHHHTVILLQANVAPRAVRMVDRILAAALIVTNMTEIILTLSIFILMKVLLIFIMVFVLTKANIIRKSAYFSCVTWYLFIGLVYFYTQNASDGLQDMGDIWLIFSVSYILVFESSEWTPIKEIQ
ncbi:hypothetical protein N5B96_12150 [Acinetobacter johnsonii]|uniref:hypothetical protein n=1 Tax=Acinetobacter johnsonii TaxID=40214 RepID=UPI00244B8B40|nr:hypothetical protein [Acinetobacter johnsonii]MDH1070218.1 hypothetical protein [Acinetobacter johnsonii]